MRNATGARLVINAVRVLVARRVGDAVRERLLVPPQRAGAVAQPALVVCPLLDPPTLARAARRAGRHHLVVVGVGARHAAVAALAVAAPQAVRTHDMS